uniref:Spindle assembly abnormal protein 6 N-terminal domain-containing protein n=1 Tax=Setaria digitata TaxID=48799 RepID=A0A915PZ43_9BILA
MVRTVFHDDIAVCCTDTNGQTTSKRFDLFCYKKLLYKVYGSTLWNVNTGIKEFVFCISRDDDPLFIYTLSLRRAEYDALKREQELDVEFDAFAKKIVDFVTCLDDNCGSHLRGSISDDAAVFRFDLVGKMGFKWVTVLSLPLRRVTDKALITHLVERIVKYKECLKEIDTLHDSLSAEQAENKNLRNALIAKEKIHSEFLQKWEEERNEVMKSKQKLEELNEELNADRQMLSQEVSTLKEEVVDFRDRIDDLIEQVNQLEERVHILTEELDASENQLRDLEKKKEELQQELSDRDEETHSRIVQMHELKNAVDAADRDNKKLHEKLQVVKEERDRWKSEHDKAVVIIKKLYGEKTRRIANNDSTMMNEKISELEKDLEERKRAIDALTDSNALLRAKLENLSSEYEKAKKDAEMWRVKCDKKESLITDLIQSRRPSPIISPPQQQSNASYGNVTPTVYPRVLGMTNWTAQITTPVRNMEVITKTLDRKENELNSVAVTPPTEVQILTGGARAKT